MTLIHHDKYVVVDGLHTEEGFDPLALPERTPGKAWFKREVSNALGHKGMWAGITVFDKAWGRLRGCESIGEVD